jgi:hypothetical protein
LLNWPGGADEESAAEEIGGQGVVAKFSAAGWRKKLVGLNLGWGVSFQCGLRGSAGRRGPAGAQWAYAHRSPGDRDL